MRVPPARTARILSASLALALFAACGGDNDAADTTPAPSSTAAATAAPTTAAPTTASPTTVPATAPATTEPTDTVAAPAGNAVSIDLAEWTVTPSGAILAGANDFTVTNSGQFPHEFMVIKGDGFASLPKSGNGAVDEDALAPGALLGSTDRITPGDTATISFDLEPGNYVLLCNIAVGPNSHAAAGQTLDITVA